MESTPGNAVLSIAFFTALTAASCIAVIRSESCIGRWRQHTLLTVASCPCWSTPKPKLTARSLLNPFGVRSLAPCVDADAICNTSTPSKTGPQLQSRRHAWWVTHCPEGNLTPKTRAVHVVKTQNRVNSRNHQPGMGAMHSKRKVHQGNDLEIL